MWAAFVLDCANVVKVLNVHQMWGVFFVCVHEVWGVFFVCVHEVWCVCVLCSSRFTLTRKR